MPDKMKVVKRFCPSCESEQEFIFIPVDSMWHKKYPGLSVGHFCTQCCHYFEDDPVKDEDE